MRSATHASGQTIDGCVAVPEGQISGKLVPGRVASEPSLDAEWLDVFRVAAECGAILYLLRARGVADEAEYASSRKRVVRIVQMVSRLAARAG